MHWAFQKWDGLVLNMSGQFVVCWAEALLTLKWPVVAPTAARSTLEQRTERMTRGEGWVSQRTAGVFRLWYTMHDFKWKRCSPYHDHHHCISSYVLHNINLCRGSSPFNDQQMTQSYLREHLGLGPGSVAEVWPQGEAGPGLWALRYKMKWRIVMATIVDDQNNQIRGNVSVSTLPHFEYQQISALPVQERSVAEHGSEGTAPSTPRNGNLGHPQSTTGFSLSSDLGWSPEGFQAPDVPIFDAYAICSSPVLPTGCQSLLIPQGGIFLGHILISCCRLPIVAHEIHPSPGVKIDSDLPSLVSHAVDTAAVPALLPSNPHHLHLKLYTPYTFKFVGQIFQSQSGSLKDVCVHTYTSTHMYII